MTTTFTKLLPLGAVLLALAVGKPAEAGILSDLVPDGRIHNVLDQSADVGIRLSGGTYSVTGTGVGLAVGDFLAAGIGFDEMERLALSEVNLFGSSALSILKIASLTPGPGALSTFTFVAPTIAEWSGIVDDVFGGLADLKKSTEGGLAMLFDEAAQDFDRVAPPNTLTASAATISNGGFELAELGFTGAVDANGNVTPNGAGEGWHAIGPTDPSSGSATAGGTILGTSFSAGLNRLEGFNGIGFLPLLTTFGGSADFTVGGTLQGYGDGDGNPIGPWQIGNDADFSFRPVALAIPEPGSLAVFGLIAGMGALSQRRRLRRA